MDGRCSHRAFLILRESASRDRECHNRPMKDAASTDPTKQARDSLGTVYADFTAASKKGLADDTKVFFGAALIFSAGIIIILGERAVLNLQRIGIVGPFAMKNPDATTPYVAIDQRRADPRILVAIKLYRLIPSGQLDAFKSGPCFSSCEYPEAILCIPTVWFLMPEPDWAPKCHISD